MPTTVTAWRSPAVSPGLVNAGPTGRVAELEQCVVKASHTTGKHPADREAESPPAHLQEADHAGEGEQGDLGEPAGEVGGRLIERAAGRAPVVAERRRALGHERTCRRRTSALTAPNAAIHGFRPDRPSLPA